MNQDTPLMDVEFTKEEQVIPTLTHDDMTEEALGSNGKSEWDDYDDWRIKESQKEQAWQAPKLIQGFGSSGNKPGWIPTRPGVADTWQANMNRINAGIINVCSGKRSNREGEVTEEMMNYEFVLAPPPTTHNPEEHPPVLIRRTRESLVFAVNENDAKRIKTEGIHSIDTLTKRIKNEEEMIE